MLLRAQGILALASLAVFVPPPVEPTAVDEGMWPFDHPPLQLLKEKYKFQPDRTWFDRLRSSTVKLGRGSGAFISPNGLIITNHHLAITSLQRASTKRRDLLATGFLARSRREEIPCPRLTISQLVGSVDITPEVRDKKDPWAEARELVRMLGKQYPGERLQLQRLYGGARYVIHRYKRYTDVRLVWAPEMSVGFFGGNDDNFTYPRFCLDVALFRVYENDKPVRPKSWLRMSPRGAKADELVFVSGYPSSTFRRETLAQVLSKRDVILPAGVRRQQIERQALVEYAKLGREQSRYARSELVHVENRLKFYEAQLRALKNKDLIQKKRAAEKAFLGTREGRKVKKAFQEIADARGRYSKSYQARVCGRLPGRLVSIGRFVTAAAQRKGEKPDDPPPSWLQNLDKIQVRKKLDELLLRHTFQAALRALGERHPVTTTLLDGKSPARQAAAVVNGSRLHEPEFQQYAAACSGEAELRKLDDPMLNLMLNVKSIMGEHRTNMTTAQRLERTQMDRIEQARFRTYGHKLYPEADGTLRLSFGTVKGYTCAQRRVPPKTTIGGLFDRCDSFGNKAPYKLPRRFLSNREAVRSKTSLNFVCTADIANGNSGSPVVNRRGQLVGVVFDGNLESLGNTFVYDASEARAVCVHTEAVWAVLQKLYKAEHLLHEIRGAR